MALKLPERPVPRPPALVTAPDDWIDWSEHPAAPFVKEADKALFAALKAKKAAGTLTRWEAYDLRQCVTGRVVERRRRRMTRDERYRDQVAVEMARTPRERELADARVRYGVKIMARLQEEEATERRDAAHGLRLVFEVEADPPAPTAEEKARDVERARFVAARPQRGSRGSVPRPVQRQRRVLPRISLMQMTTDRREDDD
jgi:hypothetical protein